MRSPSRDSFSRESRVDDLAVGGRRVEREDRCARSRPQRRPARKCAGTRRSTLDTDTGRRSRGTVGTARSSRAGAAPLRSWLPQRKLRRRSGQRCTHAATRRTPGKHRWMWTAMASCRPELSALGGGHGRRGDRKATPGTGYTAHINTLQWRSRPRSGAGEAGSTIGSIRPAR